MSVVENQVRIAGRIEPIFDLATSARYWPQWHPASRAVAGVLQRPYLLGDVIHERAEFLGHVVNVTWRIAEHRRPTHVVLQATNATARIVYAFQPEQDAVLFTRSLNYDAEILRAVFSDEKKLHELMAQQSQHSLQKLKELIEAVLAAEQIGLTP